jgi:hypothetical protein
LRITTVSATYGRKVNLGDFNSGHIEVSLWAELEPTDDEAAATLALMEMARHQAMNEIARVTQDKRLSERLQEVLMGLPVELRGQLAGVDEL